MIILKVMEMQIVNEGYKKQKPIHTLQENVSLLTNFSDQNLLVSIMTNLDTNLKKMKNHLLLK